jgi:hypothetical protein
MSIVRVGLAETRNYADGWDTIFGSKSRPKEAKAVTKTSSAKTAAKGSASRRKGAKKR